MKPLLTIVTNSAPIRPLNTSIGIARDGRFVRESALEACSVRCEWKGPKWVGPCAGIVIHWHKGASFDDALEAALVQTSTSRGSLGAAEIRAAFEAELVDA